MMNYIRQSGWLAALLLFLTPITFIFFVGIQSAYGQVKSQFEAYQNIPQVTQLAELRRLPAGTIALVRGRIEGSPTAEAVSNLIIFRERPAASREVGYQEDFARVFPEFHLTLPDGLLTVLPSQSRAQVIQHEPHTIPAGERMFTGFSVGDMVTVQGQWQPGAQPVLSEVTGITSLDQARYLAEWQADFQKVRWARDGLGLFTLLGVIGLIVQFRRAKTKPPLVEEEPWAAQTTETIPTASRS
jgi:hypothetical protein